MLALYSKRVHIPVAASFLAFFLPLPHDALLGSSDEWAFSLLSPLLVLVSSGMVVAVWYLLRTLLWVYGKILTVIGKCVMSSYTGPLDIMLMYKLQNCTKSF